MSDLCPPKVSQCPESGELHTYLCARSLLHRDPAKQEEACPGGMMICADCFELFKDFMRKAYDAQAVRQEWEGGEC